MMGPITIQMRPGSAGTQAEVNGQLTSAATPEVLETGGKPGLTIGHEEVGGLGEGAVSCQGGGADPQAVVSRLHEGQFCPARLLVG